MHEPKPILALDCARLCGFAHTNGQSGTWTLGRSGPDYKGERLAGLRARLVKAHSEWGFEIVAIEESGYGAQRQKATMAAHAEYRGIIVSVAQECGATIVGYQPSTIKAYACSGRAKKDQMMRACETILGIKPLDDNHADALWILEMAKRGYVAPSKVKKAAAKAARKGVWNLGREKIRQKRLRGF